MNPVVTVVTPSYNYQHRMKVRRSIWALKRRQVNLQGRIDRLVRVVKSRHWHFGEKMKVARPLSATAFLPSRVTSMVLASPDRVWCPGQNLLKTRPCHLERRLVGESV